MHNIQCAETAWLHKFAEHTKWRQKSPLPGINNILAEQIVVGYWGKTYIDIDKYWWRKIFKYYVLILLHLRFIYFYIYSTASPEPSFEHPSPRFTSTCSQKMTTAIGVFARVFCRYFGWLPVFNFPRQWTPRDAVYEHRGSHWPDTVVPCFIQFTCAM